MNSHPSDEALGHFLSGALDETEASSVRAHMAECDRCRQRHAELQRRQAELEQGLRNAVRSGTPASADEDTVVPQPRTPPTPTRALKDDPLPGLPGYEIIRELHRGGQGVVYEAFQRATKRKVAVKLMLGGRFATKAAQKRFEREIELVAQLKHPNIIAIFDSGLTPDGHPYYVMDYVRGARLDVHVRERNLPLEETLQLFTQVCEAIQYAHQRGVIHRDLKPSNVLVDAQNQVKILDFGLAKLLAGTNDTVVSLTEQIVGTLPYMSPEQARGNPDEIDVRTDVYSLGVMLYELLTGKYPYPVVGQVLEILKNIAETPPSPPSRMWTRDSGVKSRGRSRRKSEVCPIDDEVETIVMKALAKERQRRYQSASELARDIGHYLAGEPLEAKRDSGWYVFKKFARRQRGRIVGGVVALAFLASGVLFVQVRARASAAALKERHNKAEELTLLARRYQDALMFDEADKGFKEASALWPESRSPWSSLCLLGVVRCSSTPLPRQDVRWLEEAIGFCDRAIALEPEESRPFEKKSHVLLAMGKAAEAEAVCRSGLTKNEKDWTILSNLAKALTLQGKMPEALTSAEEAVEVARDAPQLDLMFTYVPWHTLGTLQLALGNPNAERSLDRALELAPRQPSVHLTRAQLYLADGGINMFKHALRAANFADATKFVDDPRIRRTVALAEYRNNFLEDALKNAKAALDLDAEDPVAGFVAALAAAKLGDTQAAREHFAQGKERFAACKPPAPGCNYLPTIHHGLLLIDRIEDIEKLAREAEASLAARP